MPTKRKTKVVHHRRRRGGNLLAAIPTHIKVALGKQLAKDFVLRVAAPTAAALGARKLYRNLKAR